MRPNPCARDPRETSGVMRTWRLAPRVVRCGRCGSRIEIDQPVLEIKLAETADALHRCKDCAGEPVPPDLPKQREQQRGITPRPLVRLGAVKLPFDAKLAATGER